MDNVVSEKQAEQSIPSGNLSWKWRAMQTAISTGIFLNVEPSHNSVCAGTRSELPVADDTDLTKEG
jgi:hypothetical protein